MYTVEIDFQTEDERIFLTKSEFADATQAANFATDFIRPYVEKYKVCQGEWRVYKTDNPEMIERHFKIESLLSLKAKEAASNV